jgi:hypothetical protein
VASFAAGNGWQYFPHASAQPLPGIIFRRTGGEPRLMQLATDIVRVTGAPAIEVGNGFYLETAAGNQFPQKWGYAAVEMGAPLPTVVIEAERNRRGSPLPSVPVVGAPVTLGAPEREVVLYADPAASAWASQIFRPEIVALLDDGVVAFDLELAGGYVFLYAPGKLATAHPGLWERVLSTMAAVVDAVQHAPGGVERLAGPSQPVMRSRGWAVNRRRYLLQWGALAAGVLVTAAAFAMFGPR